MMKLCFISLYQLIRHGHIGLFSLVCARMICRCVTAVGAILKIYISHGSVATRLRCCGIFNGSFIANFLQIVAVKEFLKSVNIWRRYELEYGVSLFFTHGVYIATQLNSTRRRVELRRRGVQSDHDATQLNSTASCQSSSSSLWVMTSCMMQTRVAN